MLGFVHMVQDEHRAGTCQVCGDELDEPIVRCPCCDTPHHQDCWEYNEGCSIFGCEAALSTARKTPETQGPVIVITDERDRQFPTTVALPPSWSQNLPTWVQENATFTLTLGGGASMLVGVQLLKWASRGSAWLGIFGAILCLGSLAILLLALGSAGITTSSSEGSFARSVPLRAEEPDLDELEARLARNPKSYILLEQLAFEVFGKGELKRARALYERAVALRPLMAQPHYYLGRVLAALGEDEEALKHLKAAMDEKSRSPLARKARWWADLVSKRIKG